MLQLPEADLPAVRPGRLVSPTDSFRILLPGQWELEEGECSRGGAVNTLVRPDGRTYRPRKPGLRARAWENTYPDVAGVIVFGTLDPDEARERAVEACAAWYGEGELKDPRPGWYRSAIQRGDPLFVLDEVRGAPGVSFTWD